MPGRSRSTTTNTAVIPTTIDQLVKTDNQRFLRKRYLDPMTGKDDWRIIHYGEQRVPTMGLFGQAVQRQAGMMPGGMNNEWGRRRKQRDGILFRFWVFGIGVWQQQFAG